LTLSGADAAFSGRLPVAASTARLETLSRALEEWASH